MKKRVLSLALALVIMVGIAPTAFAGKQFGPLSQTLVRTYRSAMILYDLAMVDPIGLYTPDNVFLDPHDAWDNYIATQKPNNWFDEWYEPQGYFDGHVYVNYNDDGAKAAFEATQEPSNIYPDSPEWWARLDSYVTNVVVGEHVVDTAITWEASDTKGSPYHPETLSTEDMMWAEWYDITHDHTDWAEYAPYQGMSLQEWTEMRSAMSEEDALFDEWWDGCRPWKPHKNKTFEEYKKSKGFSENQPTQPSMEPVPTVTPTATPVPTPSVAPTATPEPTPTATPARVETQPIQHFADVTPDAWYYEAVNNMAEAGILKGKGDGLFHPNDNITEAEVATIICRIGQNASERYKQIGDPTSRYYNERIVSNPSHWAERAIEASVASANNNSAATFCTYVEYADRICTREKVFVAMSRLAYEDQFPQYWHPEYLNNGQVQADGRIYYVKRLNITDEDVEKAKTEILDLRTSEYEIARCWALGIIHGDGTGHVYPDSGITRAELCQILYNMGAKTCYLDL